MLAAFGRALGDYHARRFDKVAKGFEALASLDPVFMTYLARTRACMENPPPPGWDGVTDFDSK